MGKISDIIAGIGMLIALYLVVINYRGTVAVVNAFASNATQGIKTLQGR